MTCPYLSCYPSTDPRHKDCIPACAHGDDEHYDIDGEAVGCFLCEEADICELDMTEWP